MNKIIVIFISLFICFGIFAQDAVDEEELMNLGNDEFIDKTQTPRKLSPLVAKQRAGALDTPQMRNIRALGIIHKHFGDDIPSFNSDFAEIKDIYVNAKSLFLRGDYYTSYDQYLLCREKSNALYKNAADFYIKATTPLLDEASSKALDMEIEALVSDTPDEDKNRITLAQGNLRIAFEYYNESDIDYKAGRYQNAIDNCKTAKYYVINAMINLEKDPQAAETLEETYTKDIRDALGQL